MDSVGRTLLLCCAFAAAAWPSGTAAEEDSPPLPAESLDWEKLPTGRDFAAAFPLVAQRANIEGRAVLVCRIAEDGSLKGCQAQWKDPPGYGFDAAAIRLAGKFQLKRPQTDARAVPGAEILLKISFRLPRR